MGLQTGDGAKFPTGSFDGLCWPSSTIPLRANAEIMRCSVSGDTVTMSARGQGGTSAQSIADGYQFAQVLTAAFILELTNLIAATVQSFNTRTGAVTLGAADIEALFTANKQIFQGTGNGTGELIDLVSAIGLEFTAADQIVLATGSGAAEVIGLLAAIELLFTGAGQLIVGTGNGTGALLTGGTSGELVGVLSTGQLGFVSGSGGSPGALVATGTIHEFAGPLANVPSGYLACDGSAVSRTTYAALFSAIGTTWGSGDGSTTFNVPNLQGYAPIGATTNSGTLPAGNPNVAVGGTTGAASPTVPVPQHNHGASATTTMSNASATTGISSTQDGTTGISVNGGSANIQNGQASIGLIGGVTAVWWTATSGNNLGSPGSGTFGQRGGSSPVGDGGHSHSDSGHGHGISEPNGGAGHNHGVSDSGHTHTNTTASTNVTVNNAGTSGATMSVIQPSAGVIKIIKT